MQKAARLAKRAVDRISQAVYTLHISTVLTSFGDVCALDSTCQLVKPASKVSICRCASVSGRPACVCNAGEGLVHLLCNGLGKDNFGKFVAFVYNSHSKDKGVKETRN